MRTVEPLRVLRVWKGGWAPDSDGAVVGGAGHEARQHRVPAHTVDCACVSGQLRNGQLTALVPDVHFVVCKHTHTHTYPDVSTST